MDIRSLGYLRYDDSVAYTLGINMGKYSLKTRYVQYYLNGKYMGLKTLRENFSDGSFENTFGDDGDNYTKITFQDASFTTGVVESGDGDATLYTKIKKSVTDKNFQEFKKYVDVNDFIKAQILFMFVDTENEMEGILHNDAYTGGGVKMITNVNDLDGAFFNDGHTGTGAYYFDGGGGTYRFKWTNTTSRRGAGGWFAAFSGDSTSTAMNGNLEFKTLVKDQVLVQFGTNGRGSAPLSVENVQALIQKNYNELYNSSAYKVDAAFMGMRSTIYNDWVNVQRNIQSQTVDRVTHSLERWAAYGMAHTLAAATFTDTGSGIRLNHPTVGGTTALYYTTDGSDPMGPNGAVSSAATRYTTGATLPKTVKITVRAFQTSGTQQNWGPLAIR
jgi:hypothetical protein